MKNKLSLFALFGILLFSISSVAQPYCNSSYPSYFTDYISNVNFNSISNPSGPTGYSDFTLTDITEVGLGVQYTLTATVVNFNPTTINVMAWIDWNHDYDFFDTGEAYSLGPVVGPTFGTNVSINILVPGGAVLDTTRLRISASRGFVPDPCNSAGYLFGETEDYSVIIAPSPVFWDGDVDTDWGNPLNWSNDLVPNSSVPIIIPGGAPNYPVILGGLVVGAPYGLYNCQSLVIDDGGILSIGYAGQLTIYNDYVTIKSGGLLDIKLIEVNYLGKLLIDGGVVNAEDGVVFLSLSSFGSMTSGTLNVGGLLEFQTNSNFTASGGVINCMATLDTEIINLSPSVIFNNLNVETGGSARLSGISTQEFYVFGNFNVEPGASFTLEEPVGGGNVSKINVFQNLTLEGTMSGNASFIDENGTTVITYGTTSVDNYYASTRWHFISSPVSSAVSGVFTGLYLKAFIEPSNEYTPEPGIYSSTYPLSPTKGFEVWSSTIDQSISYVGGPLNTGDLAASVTATDINGSLSIGDGEGWNLIGNPFPSAIDVGTENDPVTGYTWTNIDSTIYAWSGSSWSTFNMAGNGTGTNGGTRYLPSMQGFFLKANDFSPAFDFANSARVHNAQANYKSSTENGAEIRLIVMGNGYSDEMIVRTMNGASDLFDSKYDAYKLPGLYEVPQLYSQAGSSELSINSLPEFTEESIVPVYLKVGNNGIYKIEANNFDLTGMNLKVYLEDIKEGLFVKMNEDFEYEFSSDILDQEHRFNLVFKSDVNEDIEASKTQIYSSNDIVYINKEAGINSDVFVYDIMGREVNRETNNIDSKLEIRVKNGTGNYIVKLITDDSSETQKVFIK